MSEVPTRIGQVAVTVEDLERAKAFYRDVVGLRFLFDAPPGMAFFECGGTRLMLALPEGEFVKQASILYFDVSDIGAAYAAMSTAGATFLEAPRKVADLGDRELWLAFFRDSEGNPMALMSEPAKAAEAVG